MILGIYGTGGSGRGIHDLAEIINQKTQRWNKILFIDDMLPEGLAHDLERYHFDTITSKFAINEIEIALAVGEPVSKCIIEEKVRSVGCVFATLIHPGAEISPSAKIGSGAIIRKGAILSCDAVIGNNVFIEPYGTVGHDSMVGDNCQISQFAVIAGNCTIGKNTFIGLSVSIKEKTKVGNNVIISMGACVMRDIPDDVVVGGNPARVIRINEGQKIFPLES